MVTEKNTIKKIFITAEIMADLRAINSLLKYCYMYQEHRFKVITGCTFVMTNVKL